MAARSSATSASISPLEQVRIEAYLETLAFAERQIARLEGCLAREAGGDERVPLLVQLPGVGPIAAMTILAAVGEIGRFPSAKHLVGYAGLGTRMHNSGLTHRTGRITKAGRRDLRRAMVEVANSTVRTSAHWKAVFEALKARRGRSKAVVAVARKLLVAVWHILTHEAADRHANAEQVAASLFAFAYKVGVRRLPDGLSARAFVRQQLDRLQLGAQLEEFRWGSKRVRLPPSCLRPDVEEVVEGEPLRVAAD